MSETSCMQITAEELLALASQQKVHGGPDIPEALRRAAETVNALTVRAGKAERELCEARRELVGTRADQRTAETCARRLEAELTLAQTAASELRLQRDEARAELAEKNQAAERLTKDAQHLTSESYERWEELENARAELAALQAETADLREIERCKRSIEAAGLVWFDAAEAAQPHLRKALEVMYAAWPDGLGPCQPSTVDGWQARERWAWERFVNKPRDGGPSYRERVEAAGWVLMLTFGERYCNPVAIRSPDHTEFGNFGDAGGSPDADAIEEAVAWAEANPVGQTAPAPDPDITMPPKKTRMIQCALTGKRRAEPAPDPEPLESPCDADELIADGTLSVYVDGVLRADIPVEWWGSGHKVALSGDDIDGVVELRVGRRETHPVAEPDATDETPAKPAKNWPERCREEGHCCNECAHDGNDGAPCTTIIGMYRCCHAFDAPDGSVRRDRGGDGLLCFFEKAPPA